MKTRELESVQLISGVMDSLHFLALVLSCQILISQTIAWDVDYLSSPVITRNHRRLKGSTYKSFHSVSLVSCGLQCQRHPRCVSTNFRIVSSLGETDKGVCELNERGAGSPIEEDEDLEYDAKTIYIQFRDMKHDCQLTGCLNAGSCTFSESSKAFSCICQVAWSGQDCKDTNHCSASPCANGGSCRNIAGDFKCECIEGQFNGKHCEKVCPVPMGMESGAILNSQISASSEWRSNHAAHQARLHFKAGAGKTGSWSALVNNLHQWLQVDLLHTTKVTRTATQGRNGFSQWVTKYKLQYREDGHVFKLYRLNGDTSDTVFQGNMDRDTVVSHQLDPPIEARYVRVLPVKWYRHISMRMELYTC